MNTQRRRVPCMGCDSAVDQELARDGFWRPAALCAECLGPKREDLVGLSWATLRRRLEQLAALDMQPLLRRLAGAVPSGVHLAIRLAWLALAAWLVAATVRLLNHLATL